MTGVSPGAGGVARGAEVPVTLTCPRRGGGRGAGRERAWLGASPLFHSHGRGAKHGVRAGSWQRPPRLSPWKRGSHVISAGNHGPASGNGGRTARERLPPRGDRDRHRHPRHRRAGLPTTPPQPAGASASPGGPPAAPESCLRPVPSPTRTGSQHLPPGETRSGSQMAVAPPPPRATIAPPGFSVP